MCVHEEMKTNDKSKNGGVGSGSGMRMSMPRSESTFSMSANTNAPVYQVKSHCCPDNIICIEIGGASGTYTHDTINVIYPSRKYNGPILLLNDHKSTLEQKFAISEIHSHSYLLTSITYLATISV